MGERNALMVTAMLCFTIIALGVTACTAIREREQARAVATVCAGDVQAEACASAVARLTGTPISKTETYR